MTFSTLPQVRKKLTPLVEDKYIEGLTEIKSSRVSRSV